MPQTDFELSQHAVEEMDNRQISKDIVEDVVQRPLQKFLLDEEIEIRQSIIKFENMKEYLVRVFINVKKQPNLVITVYRTSKINKYLI